MSNVSMVDGHIDPSYTGSMTPQEAIVLLSQMYLPQFDDEEKEALTTAIFALEKQIPKKPINRKGTTYFHCPVCGGNMLNDYCADCGQALDWSDTE